MAGGGGGGAQQGQVIQGVIQQPVIQVIGMDINASFPVNIQPAGPGPILQQQGMILVAPISPP